MSNTLEETQLLLRKPIVLQCCQSVSNSRAACWVVEDGYCRRGNFGSSLVHSTF